MSQAHHEAGSINQTSHSALITQTLERAERPIVTTKFGPESAVLLHMLTQVAPDIPVVWVDTGHNTRSTHAFAAHLRERLALNLSIWQPRGKPILEGVPSLDDPEHASFTQQVKLEPFQRALNTLRPDVWFSALRHEQTEHRAGLQAVHKSPKGYDKIYPLLDWTSTDINAYLRDHDLPSETNYFDPTKGEPKRECGLHLAF
ncbi:MAG: phosphoadenosine phosphosulfate reductase family protein [Pseudomonadota bacterium]